MEKSYFDNKTADNMDWDDSYTCVKHKIIDPDIICSQIVNLGGTFTMSETYIDYNFIGVKDILTLRSSTHSGPGFMMLNKKSAYTSSWMHVTEASDLAKFLDQVLERDSTKEITKKWYSLLGAGISIVTTNSLDNPNKQPMFFIEIYTVKDKPQLSEHILKKLNIFNFKLPQKIEPFSRKRKYDQI